MTQVAAPPLVKPSFRRYALVVLLAVYSVNFLDRQIISILVEPMKADLDLSDTQIGMLAGLVFGLVYILLGLPLARLADRFNRVWILTGCLTVWSFMTVLCGRATNFSTLAFARFGVGVGEAGCVPTSHALIADYVPKEKRASALAFYSMGVPIGSLLGLAMGGIVADAYGWRTSFLIAGLPGLILAVIVFFTLKEPRRQLSPELAAARKQARSSFFATLKILASKRTFWFLALGGSIKTFIGYGQSPFTASFFLRNHAEEVERMASAVGLQPVGFIGLALGLLLGVFGSLSTWVGGAIADKYGGRDLRAYGSVSAAASILIIPCIVGALLVPSAALGLALYALVYGLTFIWNGPVYASAQGLVPPHMRATSASIFLFIINILGLGFGALALGALSDYFNTSMGLGSAEGVRWAMIAFSMMGLIAAVLFWLARARIREELVS